MITLTRTGLLLTLSTDTIPAQGSSDVPISFVNDPETYSGYTIQPLAGWYKNGCKQSAVCRYADDTITVPAAAFQQNGEIMLAIALIDPSDVNHIEVTQPASAYVIPAPNDPTELPDEDTWQTAVDNLVEQLYNQDYKPLYDQALEDINEAVQTANTASSNADLASQNVQTAYENLGDYKVENGVMYFKKADGTWNETGVSLAGQTTVNKDSAVLTELDLNTERTATPTTVKVQLKDTSGNVFYVETSPECVYLKGTDGSEISQKNLNDKIGQLINLVAFYSANPTTVLADLKKYITTIS